MHGFSTKEHDSKAKMNSCMIIQRVVATCFSKFLLADDVIRCCHSTFTVYLEFFLIFCDKRLKSHTKLQFSFVFLLFLQTCFTIEVKNKVFPT